MFGIEDWLTQMDFSPRENMLIAYVGMLMITLVAMVVLEVRNHDLAADDIPKFLKPALLYTSLLLGLELFGMTMQLSPLAHDAVASLQFGGYAAVMYKCLRNLVSTLQKLGLDMKGYLQVVDEKTQELVATPEPGVERTQEDAGLSEEERMTRG